MRNSKSPNVCMCTFRRNLTTLVTEESTVVVDPFIVIRILADVGCVGGAVWDSVLTICSD
ncbi:hypothetical protein DPMN_170834 [Dreissena polymorpha]|uniref:Uncharacterized protein n=1 Tax=Dreissena polymorpha TaxID=45954 RepID=A0A9D4DXS4_DREPO|nr:hypothetical protein DPMN_170834 [Dreissena polymorpha]